MEQHATPGARDADQRVGATEAAPSLPGTELVVVGYRSRDQVAGLLAGLPEDTAVVVVDNYDGSDGLAELVGARTGARYLSGGGVGFARAANLGARSSSAEHLVFVNPDTRPRVEQLAALVADVAEDPRCAASAAVLVGPDGRSQIGVAGWEPGVRRALVHSAGLHKLLPRAGLAARPAVGEAISVDWVSGGVMAVRRETFLRLGCFDESFYVYNEDVALGRTVREHGMTQRLRTDVLVSGDSGGSGAPSLEMTRLRGASMHRYVRRHLSGPRWRAVVLTLGAGYAVRAVQRALLGDRRRSREHWAQALGALTGRASVAGREVSRP